MAVRAIPGRRCVLAVLSVFLIVNSCSGQNCPNNQEYGEKDPKSKDNDMDTNSGFGYMMQDTDYAIGCCGVTRFWEAAFDNIAASTTVYFQIWRPVGASYTMVGEYGFTVSSNGEQSTTVPVTQRVTVQPGDFFGWWTSGADAIAYKDGGGGEADTNYIMALADLTTGDTETWGSATVVDNRSYGVRLLVTSNTAPTFTSLAATASVANTDVTGTTVFTVTVDDIDTYDVDSLVVAMTGSTLFSYDTATGIVSTAGTSDTSSTEVVTFTVTDQCGNTNSQSVTISITNEAPVINNIPASTSVSEDATTSQPLFTINATDSLSAVTCSLTTSDPFLVQLLPGSTTTYGVYNSNNPSFSFNTQSTYSLPIVCSDGELTDTETLTVQILQNAPPVFLNIQNTTSIPVSQLPGTNAFTVLTSDAEGDTLTYTMTCDPSPCPFVIFDSGEIQVSEVISSAGVGYDLNITVSDGKNTVGPSILTITITDINDNVTITNLGLPSALSIAENTALGTSVYNVSYQDLDTTQTHTFIMTSSPSDGTNYFSIDPSTGLISTAGNILDLEALGTSSFTFTVTVSDTIVTDSGTLIIDIFNVNEAPSFGQASYTLSANETSGSGVIGTPTWGVTDPDASDSYTYTMDCGTSTGYFGIDGTSGEVSFQSAYDLDVGSLPTSVTCTVTVTDVGGLTDTATLDMTIDYINDNTPIFAPAAYSYHLDYYAAVGTVLGSVTATDGDATSHGTITYSLDQTSLPSAFFTLDAAGQISVTQAPLGSSALNYSTTITIVASATDSGGLSDTANVVIVIGGSSTTVTTTTTDRYRTFIEDPKNVAWLVACIVVSLVILGVISWIVCTCKGQNGCVQFKRHFCKRCRRTYKPHRQERDWTPHRPIKPQEARLTSIRCPPPPKGQQAWRHLPM